MKDGLYRVHFRTTPANWGAGVIYAQGGKIRGGDGAIYYVGTYTDANGKVTANIKTARHTKTPGVVSVLGRDDATITLSGTVQSDGTVICTGSAAEAPGVPFSAELMRIDD